MVSDWQSESNLDSVRNAAQYDYEILFIVGNW